MLFCDSRCLYCFHMFYELKENSRLVSLAKFPGPLSYLATQPPSPQAAIGGEVVEHTPKAQ